MRLPYEGVFTLHDFKNVRRITRMIDRAVLRMLFNQRLILGSDMRPVNRFGKEDVVVPAQMSVGFFSRQNQEVLVRMPQASQEVMVQFWQKKRPGIVGMAVAVEVENVGDVDAQVFEHWD